MARISYRNVEESLYKRAKAGLLLDPIKVVKKLEDAQKGLDLEIGDRDF